MAFKRTLAFVLPTGILAVALPLLAALYLSHRQSTEEESRAAREIVGELLRRADSAGSEAFGALQRLLATKDPDRCSDEMIGLMRDLNIAARYLQAIGHVREGRLMCSSLGNHGEGIALGPVDYTSSRSEEHTSEL